jgi:phage terminase large subunit
MHKNQKIRSMEMNSIKNAVLSEVIESVEQDIDLIFDSHHSNLDLEELQSAGFAAIKLAKQTVFQGKILSAEKKSKVIKPQASKSWTVNQVESALKMCGSPAKFVELTVF